MKKLRLAILVLSGLIQSQNSQGTQLQKRDAETLEALERTRRLPDQLGAKYPGGDWYQICTDVIQRNYRSWLNDSFSHLHYIIQMKNNNEILTTTQKQIMEIVDDCYKHSKGREEVFDENVKLGMQTFYNLEKRVKTIESYIQAEKLNQKNEMNLNKKNGKQNVLLTN